MTLLFTTTDGILTPFGDGTKQWAEKKNGVVRMKEVTSSDIRSLDQNRLAWAWYRETEEFQHEDAGWGHRYCKLRIGIPILRRDSEKFRDVYDRCIKPLPYPDKLEIMDMYDVTRVMTVKQMTEYLEGIQRHWSQQGLVLEALEDDYI